MPTIKNIPGAYRLFFFSFDCNEPRHVHVQREGLVCKFWLDPLTLSRNYGFSSRDLREARQIIHKNLRKILEAWNEHCG